MGKLYLLVEGHGEVQAAQNLVVRMSHQLGLYTPWDRPRRWNNLHQWEARRGGIRVGAEFARRQPDIEGLLILRDEDDKCPRALAPDVASRLATLDLPFPVAYVLLHPEYEVLFLPCLDRMSEYGFPVGLSWDRGDDLEARRGIKEWLHHQLPPGRAYKPTVDQLKMTQSLDLPRIDRAGVPCYGSLTRALEMLRDHSGTPAVVYPPPPADD